MQVSRTSIVRARNATDSLQNSVLLFTLIKISWKKRTKNLFQAEKKTFKCQRDFQWDIAMYSTIVPNNNSPAEFR